MNKPRELIFTEKVKEDYKNLPAHIKKKFKKQIRFLSSNPKHPSLKIHRIEGHKNRWEFYIDDTYRGTFSIQGGIFVLRRAGTHKILKNP
ncbi:hypothetical protein KKH56_02775 [bacterium]|nr:hypothetical protein [bacterium]